MEDSPLKIGAPEPNAYPNVELNYYYSRENRLETMPDRIQNIHSPEPRKSGFFRSLTDTTPKLMLAATIVVLCVIIAVLCYL
jgi:hypothetical protein